jgi:formylglycine-generating enzyme
MGALQAPPVVPIPGGSFALGSASGRDDERPVHRVVVEPFLIGRTPVTNAQYRPFLEDTLTPPPPWWSDRAFDDPAQPVVGITWFEACRFAEWLSGRFGGSWRLPTEAEWERAACGGRDGAPTAWGDRVPENELPSGPIHGPWCAGRGTPNAFGLLDAGTLVHEWCLDWYSAGYYAVSVERDPRGPEEGERRASRGGSWRHHVRWTPPCARSSLPPEFRYADYGFRVIMRPRRPS